MSQEQPKRQFDQAIAEALQPALHDVLLRHGDVIRSIGVTIDYQAGINNLPGINKAFWLGPGGPVYRPDAILGSIEATLYLLQCQMERAIELKEHLAKEIASNLKKLETPGEPQTPENPTDSRSAQNPTQSDAG